MLKWKSINSSKVYCVSRKQKSFNNGIDVLIVAKCIVYKCTNTIMEFKNYGINSSKVYCVFV